MLISHANRLLFIHVPKTGGSSVSEALRPHAAHPERLPENRLLVKLGVPVNHLGPYRRRMFRKHSKLATVQRNLPVRAYERLFKFAFVRNPWDMLVSLYHYIPTRTNLPESRRVADMSFEAFVEEWTRRYRSGPALKNCVQKQWLVDARGKLGVDYVARFETLAEDFRAITRKLGITAGLHHLNRTSHEDYRAYYSDELAELVASRLADDITSFGYTFDGVAQEPVACSA